MLAEDALVMEGIGILPSFAMPDNVEAPVRRREVKAAEYSAVELESCTLWPDTPEVMVVELVANLDGGETLDVRLAVGKADWEGARAATSASSMRYSKDPQPKPS